MLDKQTRGAILLLRRKGHSLRRISRLLSLSRDSVRKVVRVGSDEPPIILRSRKLSAHRERIAHMLAEFDGNLVKVHRALADAGTSVRYSTVPNENSVRAVAAAIVQSKPRSACVRESSLSQLSGIGRCAVSKGGGSGTDVEGRSRHSA